MLGPTSKVRLKHFTTFATGCIVAELERKQWAALQPRRSMRVCAISKVVCFQRAMMIPLLMMVALARPARPHFGVWRFAERGGGSSRMGISRRPLTEKLVERLLILYYLVARRAHSKNVAAHLQRLTPSGARCGQEDCAEEVLRNRRHQNPRRRFSFAVVGANSSILKSAFPCAIAPG